MPLTILLPLLGILVGVAGTVVGVNAQIQANNYQKQIAERNRALMEENARRAIHASQTAQIQQDEITRGLLGEQLAEQSASGLRIGGRSQMLTRKSARELGRRDALNIRYQGEVDAYNFRVMALEETDKINFLNSANSNAILTGFLDAASVGLTGISNSPQLMSSILGQRKPTFQNSQTFPRRLLGVY
jgi:hypothetical protein